MGIANYETIKGTKYSTEMYKLCQMLSLLGVDYELDYLLGGYIVRFDEKRDAVCHMGSYGRNEELLETYCFDSDDGDVTGCQTAGDVFLRLFDEVLIHQFKKKEKIECEKPEIIHGRKVYTVHSEFEDEPVRIYITKQKYANGNLALQTFIAEGEEEGMPWGTMTVNFDKKLDEGYAYIDTNNFPEGAELLERYGLGRDTEVGKQSGYCWYPLWEIEVEKI